MTKPDGISFSAVSPGFARSLVRSLVFVCALFFGGHSSAAEKVVLQLKWDHEFQFAGYYAALWQGFYERDGLDVEIRSAVNPDASLLSPIEEITAGRAQFAIGALDILIARDRGEDLVILAPIFQHSPMALFALQKTELNSVQDLQNLRISALENDFVSAEVKALFRVQGLDPKKASLLNIPPTIDSLLDDSVDVIATYRVSALTSAREHGVSLKQLSPRDYGLHFYGDTLYTHQSVIDDNADLADRFLRASKRGWEYALSHKEEVAERITAELPRSLFSYDDFKAYNLASANAVSDYMDQPFTEVGYSNSVRWSNMIEQLQSIGVLKNKLSVDGLLYAPSRPSIDNQVVVLAVLGLGILCLLILYFTPTRRNILPVLAASVLLISAVEQALEENFLREHRNKLELDITRQLDSIAAQLSGAINQRLAVINGLAAHIVSNPELTEADFERYARAVFQTESFLVNIAAAPNLVIKMIYPREGNEAALGLDYTENSAQRAEVYRAVESRKMVVVGPVDLVQGGSAIMGRKAVFTSEDGVEKLWGIVSAPMDTAALYQFSGLSNHESSIDVAIRGDGIGGVPGVVFYGGESLFTDPLAVRTSIGVGEDTWHFAANPKQGWHYAGGNLWLLRFSAVVLVLGLLLYLAYRQRVQSSVANFEMQIRENEILLREVGQLALISGLKVTPDKEILQWGEQASSLMGISYTTEKLDFNDILIRFPESQAKIFRHSVDDAIAHGNSFDIEIYRQRNALDKCWLKIIGDTIVQEDGRYEILGAVQDISERKSLSDLIQRQATYDLLTNLPNRFLFNDRLKNVVFKSERDSEKLAVLFVDLDKFKPVNDSLGHQAGDKFLKIVSTRMQACIRGSDTLARYSGDEFTIILQDIAGASAVLPTVEKIISSINQPYTIEDRQIFCSASIGIAVYPDDAVTAEDLVSRADHAMYEVKVSGGNGWHFFTSEMQAKSQRRHFIHNALQQAISKNELEVFYQPIIDVRNGKVVKYEALVRWFDTNGQIMPTEEFIGIAEESGLINDIDRFVLQNSSQFLIGLEKKNNLRVGLSVNVSPRIFSSRDDSLKIWIDLVGEISRNINLTIEITERLLTEDSDRALEVLLKLKATGATIAIDDFGTGYSSLSYLTKFPIDFIKIDRSFIQNLDRDPAAETLTDTIISLAKKMKLQVIAEGVEERAHLVYLQAKECEFAQGYHLGKPMSAKALLEGLGDKNRTVVEL